MESGATGSKRTVECALKWFMAVAIQWIKVIIKENSDERNEGNH